MKNLPHIYTKSQKLDKERPRRYSLTSAELNELLRQMEPNWHILCQSLPLAIKPLSRIVCKQHWDIFSYVAHLPENRWVRRVLAWNPAIRSRQAGRTRHMWDHKVAAFCRYKELGHWLEYAKEKETLFLQLLHGLIYFSGSPPAPKTGPPHGVQALILIF